MDTNHHETNDSVDQDGIPTEGYDSVTLGPGAQVGRYKLLRVLGEGGYGIVYLAEQQHPVKRRVALKLIKPGMDSKQVIARFEAERQALALLDHPNIAHVFNAGTTNAGRPYFAMEYVKGVPITEHCDRHRLTIEERLKLFLSVCEAVQHAHQKAIIHRDIKPSNILVAFEGEQAIPMIIDFGVAKALSQSLTERTLVTEQAQMVGTPEYMSPEQAEMTSQDIDTRTDVYSLGVLLYELLTGTLPFDSQTLREGGPEQMRRMIREQDPRIPSVQFGTVEREKSVSLAGLRRTDIRTLERRLHGELDWITLKAMDKDRTRRYQTAYALAEDIQRYLNQEPVLAGPPSTIYKFRKFAARNKGVFVSVATIAIVIVLSAIISIVLAITATKAKKVAKDAQEISERATHAETEQRQKAESLAEKQELDLYFNHIKLAYHELNENRPVHALNLLEKCPEELRNWEWSYLYRQCHFQEPESLVFDANVISFDFNPDGSKLAVFLDNGKLIIRDWKTGQEFSYQVRRKLEQLAEDYVDWLSKWVAFCPDREHIAVVGDDYEIQLISLVSHDTIQRYPGHSDTVSRIVWHPRGFLFATVSEDKTIRLWDRRQQDPLIEIPPDDSKPSNLTFANDGRDLIVCYYMEYRLGRFSVKDLIQEKIHERTIGNLGTFGMGITVSPDGHHIATGLWNGRILLLNSDYEGLFRLEGHESIVMDVTFNGDGTRLVSMCDDWTMRLWDTVTGREIMKIHSEGFSFNVEFSKDGNQLLISNRTKTVKIIDASPLVETQNDRLLALPWHKSNVMTVDYNPEGDRLITSGDRGTVLWDALIGEKISDILVDGAGTWNGQFDPNGQWIVANWLQQGKPAITVWDAKPHHHVKRFTKTFDREIYGVAFSRDSRYLVIGGEDQVLYVYDWQQDKEIGKLGNQDDWIVDITFSPNGKYLASTGYYGTVKVWDATRLDEWQEGRLVRKGDGFLVTEFSPDSKQLVVSGHKGDLRPERDIIILDVESGAKILHIKNAHGGKVICVSFSPEGNYLASCGADKTVRIWDVKTGDLVDVLLGHQGLVHSVAFSPDGKHVASGGLDPKAIIWIPRLK